MRNRLTRRLPGAGHGRSGRGGAARAAAAVPAAQVVHGALRGFLRLLDGVALPQVIPGVRGALAGVALAQVVHRGGRALARVAVAQVVQRARGALAGLALAQVVHRGRGTLARAAVAQLAQGLNRLGPQLAEPAAERVEHLPDPALQVVHVYLPVTRYIVLAGVVQRAGPPAWRVRRKV